MHARLQAFMYSGKWTLMLRNMKALKTVLPLYSWPLNQGLWHSKADKIANNFHGQNWFHFHDQKLIFIIKTHICCCQKILDVEILQIFFVKKNSWSVSILSWGQNFYFQPHSKIWSIPIPFQKQSLWSTPVPFHRQNFIVKPIPFQWQNFMVSLIPF